MTMLNQNSMDGICGALCYALGIDPPQYANRPNEDLVRYVDEVFGGEKADRIVMYNTDAVAQWVYRKYENLCGDLKKYTEVEVPLRTVMPSVTPVCFGTMYTGAQPAVHGIQKYEKPVISIDTFFDALIRAGKKPAIISYSKCSMSLIFLDRKMDYYHTADGGINAVNAMAAELLLRDDYDVLIVYNGNYDSKMHKFGPESIEALGELRVNTAIFGMISNLIERNWKHHNTLVGYAMDHGCHEIDGGAGSHGLDMEEDLNVVHLYKGYKKEQ